MSIFDIPNPQLIHNYLKTINESVGTPDSSPPNKGVVLLGYDSTNSLVRRVQTTSDGKLVLWLG